MHSLSRFSFLFLSFWFVNLAKGQLITLSVEKQPLEKVLLLIEQQSGYNFIYSAEAMAVSRPVSFDVIRKKIDVVLDLCFKGQPLDFTVNDKHVVVKLREGKEAQVVVIRGKVVTPTGDPVAGASIAIKGTSRVTASDVNGDFSFTDPPSPATLQITGAEIEPFELQIGSRRELVVTVQAKANTLEETIIKGYYQTSRKLNTGAVGRLAARDISTQPVSNPLAALQGRISGLLITQSSGLPGSQFSVQIRGRNSIQGGNEPLYVVDGVIFGSDNLSLRSNFAVNNPFNTLAPEDIQSIEVLKDADATSLYGSRGANGVILITTKKGRNGPTQLEASVVTGWGKVARTMKYLNTEQYLQMRKEAYVNDGVTPSPADAGDIVSWNTTRFTDWKKFAIGGVARTTNAQVRYAGGSAATKFSVSSNYYRETTVFPGDFADQRIAVASSLEHQSNDSKFHFSLVSNYAQEQNELLNTDLSSALLLSPNAPALVDGDGKLIWEENGFHYDNPLGGAMRTYRSKIDRLTAGSSVSYLLFHEFLLRANAGINRVHLREINQTPVSSQDPTYLPRGSASFGVNDLNSWTAELQGEYSHLVGKLFKVKALAGASWQHSQNESSSQGGTGYTNDLLLNTISGAASVNYTDNYTRYRYQALYARIELNRLDKLILNLTGRRDGSSRFGPGHRFANFGAVGLAWIFSSEPWAVWLNKVVSYGKLRASYGITGNDQIGNYQYFDAYSPTSYPFLSQPGLRPIRLYNPAYSWEQKANLDLAIELGFFHNRIFINAGYFRSTSGNQIIQYTLPGQTGFTGILRNFPGLVENKGWEFDLNSRNIDRASFSWTTSFNLTIARNKLLRFPGLASSSYANTYVIGEPLSTRFLYDYTGVNPQTGLYTFVDVNRDGLYNFLDRTQHRNTNPRYYGGLQNNLRYRSLEVSVFFQFVKQDGIDPVFGSSLPIGFQRNQPTYVLDRWQKPGDIATFQKYTARSGPAFTANSLASNSTAIIVDASFIRLKNAQLAYNFSLKHLHFLHATSAKLFVQAQNLLTITSYRGPDPENQSVTAIPPLRMLSVGGRLTF